MTPKQKKVFLIIIPIVVIIIIAISLAILYITTDLFKSNQTLFLKYVSQNIEAAISVIDNTSEKEYTKLLHQNKYELNGELTAQYVEDVNTSAENTDNELNNLKLTVEGQSDYQNSYDYRDVEITYEDEEIFGFETIHDEDIYGVRFIGINQFLSAENNNLKELAKICGLTEEQINQLPDRIQEVDLNNIFSLTYEQQEKLKATYLGILQNNISPESYSKQANAIITINEKGITTTAYKLTLTQEQVNKIYINILEQLENDEVVLSKITEVCDALLIVDSSEIIEKYQSAIEEKITQINNTNVDVSQVTYTVYQVNGQTIRTTIEDDTQTIVVDLNSVGENIDITIERTIASELDENVVVVKVLKNNSANDDEISVEIQNTVGEKVSDFKVYRNKSVNGSNINVKTGIEYNDEENNEFTAKYTKNIDIVSDFEREIELDEQNNVILNNYEAEQVSSILDIVKQELTKKQEENQDLIDAIMKDKANIGNEETTIDIEESGDLSDIEKNRFNSKFEFYTGTEVSSEDLEKLLDVVKDNLETAQVSYSGTEGTSNQKQLQSIRLKIEKDKSNKELAESVMDLIETSKKYTVTIQYSETTNIVEYITIEINK